MRILRIGAISCALLLGLASAESARAERMDFSITFDFADDGTPFELIWFGGDYSLIWFNADGSTSCEGICGD